MRCQHRSKAIRFIGCTYFTVEVLGNLLERGVASLDVEEVHDNEFDHDPDVVHDVVLPSDVLQGDWVDVLVALRFVSIIRSSNNVGRLTRTERYPP